MRAVSSCYRYLAALWWFVPIMSLVAHEARSAFRAPHQIAASPVVPADSGRRERRASRPRDVPLLVGQVSRYFVHTSAP